MRFSSNGHTRGRPAARAGFTLPEVMLVLLIFLAMIALFAASFPAVVRAAHYNSTYAQATAVAQHKIDEIRLAGYGKLNFAGLRGQTKVDAGGSDTLMYFTATDELVTKDDGTPGFFPPGTVGTARIENYGTFGRRVVVQVQWPSSGGRAAGGVTLATIITQAPYPNQ